MVRLAVFLLFFFLKLLFPHRDNFIRTLVRMRDLNSIPIYIITEFSKAVDYHDFQRDLSIYYTVVQFSALTFFVYFSKRICVTTFIGGPCDTTADLYIAAVNLETASALLDTGSTCSGQ